LVVNRNFHLADLVTIMNGVCGAFSIFSSARYLVAKDPDDLWTALWLPLAGCMFDLFDGKIARWRKASSMLGQELDSLADLVRRSSLVMSFPIHGSPLRYPSAWLLVY
jgi:CDP-diacylglycerol--serine O-phosphatidyltransferase